MTIIALYLPENNRLLRWIALKLVDLDVNQIRYDYFLKYLQEFHIFYSLITYLIPYTVVDGL